VAMELGTRGAMPCSHILRLRTSPPGSHFCDGGLAFAGLWDEWRGPEEQLLSCTIVVGRPNALVAEIHDRMVVNLPEEAYATWLIREPAWIPCDP
jgi:hypothetical protein